MNGFDLTRIGNLGSGHKGDSAWKGSDTVYRVPGAGNGFRRGIKFLLKNGFQVELKNISGFFFPENFCGQELHGFRVGWGKEKHHPFSTFPVFDFTFINIFYIIEVEVLHRVLLVDDGDNFPGEPITRAQVKIDQCDEKQLPGQPFNRKIYF